LHGIDDYPLTDGDIFHVVANMNDLAGGFVADGGNTAGAAVNAADFDIAEVAAANATGFYFRASLKISPML
jgi:hypothetical protein